MSPQKPRSHSANPSVRVPMHWPRQKGELKGGRLRGGFEKTTNLTGGGSMSESPPNRVVLIKFDNVDTAKKWWDTDGKKTNEIGAKFADFKVTWVIEGIEPK
jgi:hypothetical protein